MNCEPGDLAVIVRNTSCNPCMQMFVGITVTVVDLQPNVWEVPLWNIKPTGLCCRHGAPLQIALDADLQPIRGPKPGEQVPTDQPLLEEQS